MCNKSQHDASIFLCDWNGMFEEALEMLHFFLDVFSTALNWKCQQYQVPSSVLFLRKLKRWICTLAYTRTTDDVLFDYSYVEYFVGRWKFRWKNKKPRENALDGRWIGLNNCADRNVAGSPGKLFDSNVFHAQCLRLTCNESCVNICVYVRVCVCVCICE